MGYGTIPQFVLSLRLVFQRISFSLFMESSPSFLSMYTSPSCSSSSRLVQYRMNPHHGFMGHHGGHLVVAAAPLTPKFWWWGHSLLVGG